MNYLHDIFGVVCVCSLYLVLPRSSLSLPFLIESEFSGIYLSPRTQVLEENCNIEKGGEEEE